MTANAISFANPIPKVYKTLPPPIEEMDDVLAFIYLYWSLSTNKGRF
jgi:hypothetical protein